jgi:hypothetical protein
LRVNRPTGNSYRPPVEDVFLSLLPEFVGQGRHLSPSPHGSNYAPKMLASHPRRQGYTMRDFKRAMEHLFAANRIKVIEDGPPSKSRRFLVPA